jgi:hypothetical protein
LNSTYPRVRRPNAAATDSNGDSISHIVTVQYVNGLGFLFLDVAAADDDDDDTTLQYQLKVTVLCHGIIHSSLPPPWGLHRQVHVISIGSLAAESTFVICLLSQFTIVSAP